MSRSQKKNPIAGMTSAASEKWDKRVANRRVRRRVKEALATDPMVDVLPDRRELSDPWTMAKDGKKWFDPRRFPGVLRK
jgi:hypothetical protein